MRKAVKSILMCVVLVFTLVAPFALTGCSKKGGPNSFTVWLASSEKDQFYMNYDKNPIVKYLNGMEWGEGEDKAQLEFTYHTPAGTPTDNFATLVNGGSYDDIMALDYAQESVLKYYEDGVAMDITDYVNEYMPNYKRLVESNPEIYREAITLVDGKPRYLSLWSLNDGPRDMFNGLMYRRDWLVRFGEMPRYVWANSAESLLALPQEQRQSKAPAITNYFRAYESYGDNEAQWTANGWKKNTLYNADSGDSFTVRVGGTRGKGIVSNYGDDAMNTYTDNLVFPSGSADPITLSDWEWMFETFEKNVWNNANYTDGGTQLSKSNTYMTSVYYMGTTGRGDFSSSFGKGAAMPYLDADTNQIVSGPVGENTRLYLQYMNGWYRKGWLDNEFSTRSGDQFYQIDTKNVNAGRVGAMIGHRSSQMGNALDSETLPFTQGIMFVGARLPMNDVVGEAANRFVQPDTIYQEGLATSKCMITTEAEGKNLPALFSYLDYFYSEEGAKLASLGLSKEQYEQTQDSFYKEHGLTEGAYSSIEDSGDGRIYKWAANNPENRDLNSAARANRLPWGYHYVAAVDHGYSTVEQRTVDNWNVYPNKGDILTNLVNKIEADTDYNQAFTQLMEIMQFNMSSVIKASESNFNRAWNDFKNTIETPARKVCNKMQETYDKYNNL